MALAACSGTPPDRAAEADLLRACATITSRCVGMAALSARLPPDICRRGTCFLRHPADRGVETLAAHATPLGVCGYRHLPGAAAVLGIWRRGADGTISYRTARLLDPQAAPLGGAAEVRSACAELVTIS